MERVASLEEIERHWSLDDVARANALLDMRSDIEAQAREEAAQR